MQPSWQLARNSLAGRPLRTMLVLGASIIACALIVTISCAFASAQHAMDAMIRGFVGNADARIIHKFSAPYDAAIIDLVRSWPEVQDTLPYIGRSTSFQRVDEHDELVGDPFIATLWGNDLPALTRFREVTLSAGAMPQQPDEILIGPAVAENLGVGVGDTLAIRQAGDDPRVVVAGIIDRPQLMILQNPIARIDRERLVEITGAADEVSTIMIRLHENVDADAFVARYKDALPKELTLETTVFIRAGFNRSVDASRLGMIIMAMFTFMSAAFIIVIGMTSGVIERQRELAMLRAIGATRSHLAVAQLLTGALVGGIGLLLGLPLGLGIAWGLVEYYDQYVPDGLAVSTFGLWLTVVGAFVAGELGAIYPAWLASRVSPLEAMSRTARPVRGTSLIIAALCALLLIAAPMLLRLVFTSPDARFWTYGFGGLPLGFAGVLPPLRAGDAAGAVHPRPRVQRRAEDSLRTAARLGDGHPLPARADRGHAHARHRAHGRHLRRQPLDHARLGAADALRRRHRLSFPVHHPRRSAGHRRGGRRGERLRHQPHAGEDRR
jgi:ABC-type lipoprotein release transport system permease subunit